ncbi:MAG: oligosaccharide repeat unit polymerase [Promethearchaeota archaeon]|jgi:O-antigen ligase
MFELTTSQFMQIILALSVGIFVFLTGYFVSERYTVSALILIIPFQFVASKYGTANMVLTYLLGVSMILSGKIKGFPFLRWIFFIMSIYMLSFSQVHKSTYVFHLFYLISIFSNFFLFYIIYNFIINEDDPKLFINLLIVLNVLVIIYALAQMIIDFERLSLFGVEELSVSAGSKIAGREIRLRGGPFGAIGINAEYLVIQSLIMGYLVIYIKEKWKKVLSIGLLSLNVLVLIATGNRGGFFSIIIGSALFFYFYRKQIGSVRIVAISLAFLLIFTIMSFITVKYTKYDSLFRRVSETELVHGMPSNRYGVWTLTFNQFLKKPILGHGPRLHGVPKLANFQEFRHYDLMPNPHNLYLYILYTLGFLGLIAYVAFWGNIYNAFRKTKNKYCDDVLLDNLPRLGMIILAVFLFDQMKVEFLRYKLTDYQHYIFMLFGAFVGFSHILQKKSQIIVSTSEHEKSLSSRETF